MNNYGFEGNMTAQEWLELGLPVESLQPPDIERLLKEGVLTKAPNGSLVHKKQAEEVK